MWPQGITAPNKREDDAMLKEPGSNLGVEKPCKQGNCKQGNVDGVRSPDATGYPGKFRYTRRSI